MLLFFFFFFFFQAEDGIRDTSVTGVQTCALPISTSGGKGRGLHLLSAGCRVSRRQMGARVHAGHQRAEIGRASCREKSVDLGGRRIIKKKKKRKEREKEQT